MLMIKNIEMSINESNELKPVYKYFRGKWKELGADKTPLPQIEETEYCVKDFENKSIIELEELIIRQEKLFHNKFLLSKLKDKGEKIKKKYEVLQNALKIKKEQNECHVSRINSQDLHEDINSIEWNGLNRSSNIYNNNLKEVKVDSDEEERNPLQLLARHSIEYPPTTHNRLKDEQDAFKLIEKELEKLSIEDSITSTEKDTTSYLEFSNDKYFGHKLLSTLNEKQKSSKKRELFKPNRPNNTNKSGNEITARVIPIEESLKLLSEANKNEQMKTYFEAAEALKNSKPNGMLPATNYLNYRDANRPQHFLDDDDDDISESLYFGRVIED